VSKASRKERLRREREERERQLRAAEQRKRMVGYAVAGLLAVAVVIVAVVAFAGGDDESAERGDVAGLFPEGGSVPDQQVTDLREAADAAGCELIDTRSRGQRDRLHVEAGTRVRYRGNPPTLGPHWPPGFQAEDGIYAKAPADEALVHTMEHGRVVIWAKPSLPVEVRRTLRALFDEDGYQLVLTPRRDMPYAVAATAWNGEPEPGGTGRTLGCPEWNEAVVDALRTFRDEHRSRGPEAVP
jgi:Protein of unknown function (DUF3105)